MNHAHQADAACRGARVAQRVVALSLAISVALLAGSCGGDSGPAEPSGLSILLGSPRVQITRTVSIEALTAYARSGDRGPDCDWYVDGILGGNPMVGTITQTNPAVFTAPPAVPDGGAVEIGAVSRTDSGFDASDSLRIVFTVRYVDPATGSDTSSSGTWTSPLRTLTYALDMVADGDTLVVLPGSYDPDNGEAGSYFVPGGVTLMGVNRDSCILYGAGSDDQVVRLGDEATVEGFTIGNWDEDRMAILSTGGGLIRNIAILEPFSFSAVRADGGRAGRESSVVIADCLFENSSDPLTGRALELYYGTHCIVRDCTISGWRDGVYVNRDSDPLIEGTVITENVFGVIAAGGGGLPTQPDLGGGARGSEGGNTISDNTLVGIRNQTDATLWALDNTWTTDPPSEGPPYPTDLENTAGGSIVWSR